MSEHVPLRQVGITLVESMDELDTFRRWLGERRPILAVDTETTGLSRTKDKIRLVQFGDANAGFALPYQDWRGAVKEVLAAYDGPTVAHNLKFDAGMLAADGIEYPWEKAHDSMFMCALINSLGPKALKTTAKLYVDPLAAAGQSSLKKLMNANKWTWETVPIDCPPYWQYACLDTVLTARLAETLWPKVQYAREAYDLEMACSRVLMGMELRGIRIDVPYIREDREVLEQELGQLEDQLGGLNFNSSGQIIAALMEQGAKFTKLTEKNQLSTDDEVMAELEAEGFAMAGLIRKARADYKIAHSYYDNWLKSEEDGFLHPSINQLAARTHRMSITNPALQTLHKSKRVRRAFVPREGNLFAFIDYENQEVRVAAHLSGDEAIIRAFAEGLDLHSETAKRIFGTAECSHDFKCKHRAVGKASFLGKLYGSGYETLADTSGMPLPDAKRMHQALDELYPGLARAMAKISRSVQQRGRESGGNGWVVLPDGRKIMVPANQGYKGINAWIQGTSASVLKRAIVDLDLAGFGDVMVLPVHDELAFDLPRYEAMEMVREIERVMTRTDFRVPLTVESEIVENWGVKYD